MKQTEYFGNDSLKNILNIISIHSAKKKLLVTGKESYLNLVQVYTSLSNH